MNRAFSLLEIIIVLIITSILITFFLSKSKHYLNSSLKTKIKADVALIRNAISKEKTKNILLNNDKIFSLDNSSVGIKNIKLFTNILQYPLISTNENEKELGKWIKTGNNTYKIFYTSNLYLTYKYENHYFKCISALDICEEFE